MASDNFKHLQPPFVLLENSLHPEEGGFLFESPHELITANSPAEIEPAFKAIEAALTRGEYLAGFMTYELGLALEPKLEPRLKNPSPLLWFGVFGRRETVSNDEIIEFLDQASLAVDKKTDDDPHAQRIEIIPSESFTSYHKKFKIVKDNITKGDIYQLNLTFKAKINNVKNPIALYRKMRQNQPVAFGSLIMTGEKTILSASPELFIKSKAGWLETRPMKGTMKRGPRLDDQARERKALQQDEKSRAENLMIVDLMRNDLGRISELGSVTVDHLFKVETYRSLHQMISIVRSKKKKDLTFLEQMKALFPPGSITGAPKIRAMELIDELEDSPRSLYTGAIGYITPEKDMAFNVAIRTIELDSEGQGEIGIGSGLVYDSKARAEYDECLLKMKFLKTDQPEFSLIETIGFLPEKGMLFLKEHMDRLSNSARYFNYPIDIIEIKRDLINITRHSNKPLRLRLLLSKTGNVSITQTNITPPTVEEQWRVTFAKTTQHSENPFLYHKTTHRDFYDDARLEIQKERETETIHEVIFENEHGEITEGSFTNVFVEKDGLLITPPVSCGLLAGTLRQSLLEKGRALEAVLTRDDLTTADTLYVGNSVRGLIKAKLV